MRPRLSRPGGGFLAGGAGGNSPFKGKRERNLSRDTVWGGLGVGSKSPRRVYVASTGSDLGVRPSVGIFDPQNSLKGAAHSMALVVLGPFHLFI